MSSTSTTGRARRRRSHVDLGRASTLVQPWALLAVFVAPRARRRRRGIPGRAAARGLVPRGGAGACRESDAGRRGAVAAPARRLLAVDAARHWLRGRGGLARHVRVGVVVVPSRRRLARVRLVFPAYLAFLALMAARLAPVP